MKKLMLTLLATIAFVPSMFGYSYTVKNTTGSNITAAVHLAGRSTAHFDIPAYSTRSQKHGIYCAYSLTLIANDGELAGQQVSYSLGSNTCRNVSLRTYKVGSALQVDSY